jgi:hypothetical protein
MYKSTIAWAILATVLTQAARADDFSALLADLSFGDAAAQRLQPAHEPEQHFRSVQSDLTMPDLDLPPVSLRPQASLQQPISTSPPSPATTTTSEQIDLDAAFAAQESRAGVRSQTVGHQFHGSGQQYHGNCPGGCADDMACTPHTAPNLPSSTFYQYFRSNKCNSHVWDGYRQPCRSSNAHLNGSCDCFNKCRSCGEIVECTDCCPRLRLPALPCRENCDQPPVAQSDCDG